MCTHAGVGLWERRVEVEVENGLQYTVDFSPAYDCLSLIISLPSVKHMTGKGSFSSPNFSLPSGEAWVFCFIRLCGWPPVGLNNTFLCPW